MIIVARIAFKLTHVKCDENRTVDEIVSSRGFKLESHAVQTPDGYILTLHRIINPFLSREERNQRNPILLMHGMGTHSLFWLLNDDLGSEWVHQIDKEDPYYDARKVNNTINDSLGFELCKRGHDVWLGNQRGNRFSQRHAVLKSNNSSFWNFSLDEIALFDIPATVDYILALTKRESLAYVGFSQGSTAMLALMTQQPRFNQIIRPFICMAPCVKTTHSKVVKGMGQTLISWGPSIATYFPGLVYPAFLEFLIQLFFCNHSLESISNTIGRSFYASKYLNSKRVSTFLSFPGVHASRKNATQYLQYFKGPFARFDYGKKKNLVVYGRKTPPDYDLSNISCENMAIIYSIDDSAADEKDVRWLRSQLKNTDPYIYLIRKPKKWDHQDFQLGKDCGSVVNSRILLMLSIGKKQGQEMESIEGAQTSFYSIKSTATASSPSTSLNDFVSLDKEGELTNERVRSSSDPSPTGASSSSTPSSSSSLSSTSSSFEVVTRVEEEEVLLRKRK